VNHGNYAYVYLEGDDLARISAHLKITEAECIKRYCDHDDGHLVLRMDDPDCPFLDAGLCSIYAARPTQCSTFPFWEENLASSRAWRGLRRFCPGVGRGERHPLDVIRGHLAQRKPGG
jgi:Fe-S-cluster containining protein